MLSNYAILSKEISSVQKDYSMLALSNIIDRVHNYSKYKYINSTEYFLLTEQLIKIIKKEVYKIN